MGSRVGRGGGWRLLRLGRELGGEWVVLRDGEVENGLAIMSLVGIYTSCKGELRGYRRHF